MTRGRDERAGSRWALRAARVFNGDNIVDVPVVLIEGDTIAGVGVTPPESIPVVDLGDVTLLPGLIDCHQHLCFDGNGSLDPPLIVQNREITFDTRRRLLALGATIVAGTDAGINLSKPHDVLPHALPDFVEAGMKPIEGLRALTTVGARVCGVGDRKGKLAPGFRRRPRRRRRRPTHRRCRTPSSRPRVASRTRGAASGRDQLIPRRSSTTVTRRSTGCRPSAP